MSSTRHASEDSEFRQERYMSSPEMHRGLLANCVAARVQALADPLHRQLVWWLQKVSWQPGGLEQLANEIMQRWPERFATTTMQRLGIGPDRIYSAEEVKQARRSMCDVEPFGCGTRHISTGSFPLRGEGSERGVIDELLGKYDDKENRRKWSKFRTDRAAHIRQSRAYPRHYPAKVFQDHCLEIGRERLAKFLFEKLCLDPAVELNAKTLWYFPQLAETLAELHDIRTTAAEIAAPTTQIGLRVNETLDYSLAERVLVVVDGVARTGKTFAVKAWCEAHPGQARYVQVPSSNDETSFFRALADALGIGSSYAHKALELRTKVESVLQTGDLLLVLDEGHYLWPSRNLRKPVPHRINWMLTQLVNMGVPVAIVTTPQFTKSQETVVRAGGWSSEQLIGRMHHYERLPEELCESDLEAVARHWMPGGEEKAIRTLITYAQGSEKHLQGIEALVRRSRFLAKKANRPEPGFEDVAAALKAGVVPSDNALASALSGARATSPRRAVRKASVEPLQAPCRPAAKPMPARAEQPAAQPSTRGQTPAETTTFTPPVRDTGDAVLSP